MLSCAGTKAAKRRISLPVIRTNITNDCSSEPTFAKSMPVIWAPQFANNFAETIVQSAVPLLSLLSRYVFGWSTWDEAEYILHLDGLPLPQYYTNLLRPFARADDAIQELSLVGDGTTCGTCYGRIWVCDLDNRQTAYEDLDDGDARYAMLRRGLVLLRGGVNAHFRRSFGTDAQNDVDSTGLSVGVVAREQARELQEKGRHSRQILNLKALLEAMDQKGIHSQVRPTTSPFDEAGDRSVVDGCQVVLFEKLSTAAMLGTMAKLNVLVGIHGMPFGSRPRLA